MAVVDPKLDEYLRGLPSGYLLDLLADSESLDDYSINEILKERGLTLEDIEYAVKRRQSSRWPRGHVLWQVARWATLVNTLIVTIFNAIGFYDIVHSDHPFTGVLLFLMVACIAFGFFIGYKLSTQIYQGSRTQLHCGFPVAVATIDLETSREKTPAPFLLTILIGINAITGVVFTLFPLMLIHWFLK